MKRVFTIILMTALIVSGLLPAGVSAEQISPELMAETAVLINAKTGQILFDKVKDYQEYPASTTKVMTALLVLENKSLDDVVTISHNAAYTGGSRIYLLEGEHITVEQLLYAMMLESANDAAVALAESVSGSVEAFATLMNERAKELGAVNTNFVTPNGLPNEQHVTTAYDLALITMQAMQNQTFRKIVSTYSYTIPATDLQPETRSLHNTNHLLYDTRMVTVDGVQRPYKYEGILGVKTGYTVAAQSCLIAAAERDGMEIIGVILKSTPDYQYSDMIKLLDYGFGTYAPTKILTAGEELDTAKIHSGKEKKVGVTVPEDVYASSEVLSDGSVDKSKFSYTTTVYSKTAPVKKGDVAGYLTLFVDDKESGTYDLVYMDDVEAKTGPFRNFSFSPTSILRTLMILLMGGVIAYGIFVVRIRRAQAKAKAERRAKREERMRRYEAKAENAMMDYSDNILSEYDVPELTERTIQPSSEEPDAEIEKTEE